MSNHYPPCDSTTRLIEALQNVRRYLKKRGVIPTILTTQQVQKPVIHVGYQRRLDRLEGRVCIGHTHLVHRYAVFLHGVTITWESPLSSQRNYRKNPHG